MVFVLDTNVLLSGLLFPNSRPPVIKKESMRLPSELA